jgi:hypothetical protein
MQKDTGSVSTIQDRAFLSFLKTLWYFLGGRLHFPKGRIGEVIKDEDGQEFVIFRQVFVDPAQDQPKRPAVTLRARFQFSRGSTKQNKLLSRIPIPFILGLPGFRSKTWTLNEPNGYFQGIYEWDTVRDAEIYKKSFAIKLMTKRAALGSITFEIASQ